MRNSKCVVFAVALALSGGAFAADDIKVSGTEAVEQMKKMGYAASILDDTPDLWCAKLTTPSSMSGAQFVECHALTKGHYFEIQAVGSQMTPEKTKALVAKTAARLP